MDVEKGVKVEILPLNHKIFRRKRFHFCIIMIYS